MCRTNQTQFPMSHSQWDGINIIPNFEGVHMALGKHHTTWHGVSPQFHTTKIQHQVIIPSGLLVHVGALLRKSKNWRHSHSWTWIGFGDFFGFSSTFFLHPPLVPVGPKWWGARNLMFFFYTILRLSKKLGQSLAIAKVVWWTGAYLLLMLLEHIKRSWRSW